MNRVRGLAPAGYPLGAPGERQRDEERGKIKLPRAPSATGSGSPNMVTVQW
jgi:hypothetical protein